MTNLIEVHFSENKCPDLDIAPIFEAPNLLDLEICKMGMQKFPPVPENRSIPLVRLLINENPI